MANKAKLPLISLFAGAGGMDIGFAKAGFTTVWANEYDKTIVPSYQQYFPNVIVDSRSITDIAASDIPSKNIVGIIGGPPCQSWSIAGARRGVKDERGQLFFEYVRLIKEVKPLFFVAENVKGILQSRNRESFTRIIKLFRKLGYTISWKLLNASDYGVPQDRERVFIVGYDQSLGKKFSFPEALPKKVTLREAIGDLAKFPADGTAPPPCPKNHEFVELGFSPLFLASNRVRGWDEQSYTILATARHIPFHPKAPKMIRVKKAVMQLVPGKESEYRRLTVRECARIQTFPDDYEFLYTSPTVGYKMVGNAVPVNLAYAIAKAIKTDLF
jgi:DNA (cytosine-5)-methyltransferase 1